MSHLDTEEIRDYVQQHTTGLAHVEEHLRSCARCRDGVAAMAKLSEASESVANEAMGELIVPPFERLRAALPAQTASPRLRPGTAFSRNRQTRGAWLESLRLTAELVRVQLRLLPRSLFPLSVLGFVAAVLLTRFMPVNEPSLREHAFGAVVVLVVLIGTLTAHTRGLGPRSELPFSLPISPPTVFVCRVVGVLGVNVLFAAVGSLAVHALGGTESLYGVLTSWFGQALLTVGVALVCAVAHAPVTGALAGGLVWMLGSSSILPWAAQLPLHSVVSTLWASSPAVLALSVALLAAAAVGMRFPQLSAQP